MIKKRIANVIKLRLLRWEDYTGPYGGTSQSQVFL
jgi:hypothetical protein